MKTVFHGNKRWRRGAERRIKKMNSEVEFMVVKSKKVGGTSS